MDTEKIRLVRTPDGPPIRKRKWRAYDAIIDYVEDVAPFAIDAGRTRACKSGRRLGDRTQVLGPERGIHIRTRASHTADVVDVMRRGCILLGLNPTLGEAQGEGHDIGHVAYGHIGEQVLSRLTGLEIEHSNLSSLILQHIESRGFGLNLDWRVLHAIAHHSLSSPVDSMTPEAELLRYADKFAYLSADVNDLRRAYYQQLIPEIDEGIVDEMSWRAKAIAGNNQHNFIYTCLMGTYEESIERGYVSFRHSEIAQSVWSFKDWMYENIYSMIDWTREIRWLELIYEFFDGWSELEGCDPALMVALLTDIEAREMGIQLEDGRHPSHSDFMGTGVQELVRFARGQDLDLTDPGLGWYE